VELLGSLLSIFSVLRCCLILRLFDEVDENIVRNCDHQYRTLPKYNAARTLGSQEQSEINKIISRREGVIKLLGHPLASQPSSTML
jgi:hypothetical protein